MRDSNYVGKAYVVIDATLKTGDIQQVLILQENYPENSDPQDYFVREIKDCNEYIVWIDDPKSVLSPGPFAEEI